MRALAASLLLVLISSCSVLDTLGLGGLSNLSNLGLGRADYTPKKREFRGVWLPTIFRAEYSHLSRMDARALFTKRLDLLRLMGCNAVIFQVRAEGDAWYRSEHDPWSRYLSGEQGAIPEDGWDPLAFVIEECHRRGMELHAWINPTRAASDADEQLSEGHIARRRPEWFVRYNKQLVLDPGIPEGRKYVCMIVDDITRRYDIDAIHLDDFLYPHPVEGQPFPDDASFAQYGLSAGYRMQGRGDWRRENLNQLIRDISQTIRNAKPWVRLGVSPYGIYRHESKHHTGSPTRGMQSYDDLYADVLHWVDKDWVDYVAPQLHWPVGDREADYTSLAKWWGVRLRDYRTQLYIGQDLKRMVGRNQVLEKMQISQAQGEGNVFWSAGELLSNYGNVSEDLRTKYQNTRALLPIQNGFLGRGSAPAPIRDLWEDRNEQGHMIAWEHEGDASEPESAFYYAVYAFPKGKWISTANAAALVNISTDTYYNLPRLDGATEYTILVTAINRFWMESAPRKIVVRL